MKYIQGFGAINYDESFYVDKLVVKGKIGKISNRVPFLGGSVLNTLVGLNKYDINVKMFGKIGSDISGNFLQEQLKEKNIEFNGVISKGESGRAVILVDKKGQRTIYVDAQENDNINYKEDVLPNIDITGKNRPDLIVHGTFACTSSYNSLESQLELTKEAREEDIPICLAPGTFYFEKIRSLKPKMIDELVKSSSVISANNDEIIKYTKEEDYKKAAKYLIEQGVELVCVTLGNEGAFLINNNEESCELNGRIVRVEDTTGAGDSFFTGVLLGVLNSKDIQTTGLLGIVNSAHKVQYKGGCDYPPSGEITKIIKEDLGIEDFPDIIKM